MINIEGFEKYLANKISGNFDSVIGLMKYYEEYYKEDYENSKIYVQCSKYGDGEAITFTNESGDGIYEAFPLHNFGIHTDLAIQLINTVAYYQKEGHEVIFR